MSDPKEADEGWADLARELGLEGFSSQSKEGQVQDSTDTVEESAEPDADGLAGDQDAELPSEFDSQERPDQQDDDEADPADDSASNDVEDGQGSDGEESDGSGKKKRRRRRRRKKKGDADKPEGAEPQPATAQVHTQAPEEVVHHDPSELIAKWNVPSWEEIVAGLHRPN